MKRRGQKPPALFVWAGFLRVPAFGHGQGSGRPGAMPEDLA
jgi:hypothetical protein